DLDGPRRDRRPRTAQPLERIERARAAQRVVRRISRRHHPRPSLGSVEPADLAHGAAPTHLTFVALTLDLGAYLLEGRAIDVDDERAQLLIFGIDAAPITPERRLHEVRILV